MGLASQRRGWLLGSGFATFVPVLAAAQTPETPLIDIDDGEPAPTPAAPAAAPSEPVGVATPAVEGPQPETGRAPAQPPKPAKRVEGPVPPQTMREWFKAGHPFASFYVAGGVGWASWRRGSQHESTFGGRAEVGFGLQLKVFGFYPSVGGVFGGNLYGGAVKANYLRVGFMARLAAGRWASVMFGPGMAVSFLRAAAWKESRYIDLGIAVPVKLVVTLPLPRYWSLGVAAGYEFNYMPHSSNVDRLSGYMIHVLSAELLLARW